MNKTCTHYFGRLCFSFVNTRERSPNHIVDHVHKSCLRTTDIHTYGLAATIHTYGTWFKHKAITRRCCAVNMENICRTRFRHFVSVSVVVFSFQYTDGTSLQQYLYIQIYTILQARCDFRYFFFAWQSIPLFLYGNCIFCAQYVTHSLSLLFGVRTIKAFISPKYSFTCFALERKFSNSNITCNAF